MLNAKKISDKINKQLRGIGINPEVNGEPSHTANMIEIIVKEIILSIQMDAQVITTVNTTGISSSVGTPEVHNGTGQGRVS